MAAILAGCVALPADPATDAVVDGDSGGLPTKPLDAGLGTKDSGGLGTKPLDAGLGTNDDAGLGNDDAGLGTTPPGPGGDDAGMAAHDAASGTVDAGTPGLADGGIGGCLACAEQRCGAVAIACVHSSACVEEAECDLMCLDMAGRGQGGVSGPDPRCFPSCIKNQHASPYAPSAVACALALCPKECLPELSSCAAAGGRVGEFTDRR
jgi:hypothetical protein